MRTDNPGPHLSITIMSADTFIYLLLSCVNIGLIHFSTEGSSERRMSNACLSTGSPFDLGPAPKKGQFVFQIPEKLIPVYFWTFCLNNGFLLKMKFPQNNRVLSYSIWPMIHLSYDSDTVPKEIIDYTYCTRSM